MRTVLTNPLHLATRSQFLFPPTHCILSVRVSKLVIIIFALVVTALCVLVTDG